MTTLLASGIVALLLDQYSKKLVRVHLSRQALLCGSVVRLVCVRHIERSYQSKGVRAGLVLLFSAAFLSAMVLHASGDRFQSGAAGFGLGVALGGAAGNLFDILRLRYVVDFIDLRWWPVFNLADLAIVAGLALAFLN